MPSVNMDDLLMLERQSERLGMLWRSQGQEFLDEQAAALQEDVERLREAYLARAEPARSDHRPKLRLHVPRVIDLREPNADIVGRACITDGHGDVEATERCSRCHEVYCAGCILNSPATHGKPLCTECALIVSGVHHKRIRTVPAASAAGRSKR